MAKRTAQELWDALDEATLDAEIESALAMTPEERRQALIEDGYDIDALHANADAFFASLPEKVASTASPAASPTAAPKEPSASEPVRSAAPVVPIRARKAWIPWLAAAAAIAVVGGGIGINSALTPAWVGSARTPKADAAWLRDAAQIDCDARRWEMCRGRLDEAAREDRAGEGEPRVVKMREGIEAGLAPGSGDAH
jgi:hypothetical protein